MSISNRDIGSYPTFFIVGAAKAGTTTLYHLLNRHPEVFFPANKEPNYFALLGKRPNFTEYGSHLLNSTSVYERENYELLYKNTKSRHRGDASPSYLYTVESPQAIAAAVPTAKIIVILRDPAERAFSSFLHMRAQGAETAKTFEEALERERYHIENNWWFLSHYKAASRYGAQLGRYYTCFDRSQILVIDFRDLSTSIDKVLERTCKFLGLSMSEAFMNIAKDAPKKFNESFEMRSPLLRKLLIEKKYGMNYLRHLLPARDRAHWASSLRRIASKPRPVFREDTRGRLIAEFDEDIRSTEKLTALSFDHWRDGQLELFQRTFAASEAERSPRIRGSIGSEQGEDAGKTARQAKILIVEREPYPPVRVDVTELFCEGLAKRGLVIDWSLPAAVTGRGTVVAGANGQRFFVSAPRNLRWIPRRARRTINLLNMRGAAALRALSGNYELIQARDVPIFSALYLLAAKLTGKKFTIWLSFPMLEAIETFAFERKETLGRLTVLSRVILTRIFQPIFYRIILSSADHVFVQSQRMLEYVVSRGMHHERITAVPMAVNIDKLNRQNIPDTTDYRCIGKVVLTYVGALEPYRQIDQLVGMMPLLVRSGFDCVLFLVGRCSKRDQDDLEALADRLNVSGRVFFTGYLPLEQAMGYVRRADIALSPVPSNFILDMGTPTKLVEYLALGRPVVASKHPDQMEIIESSGAGLCTELTAEAFATSATILLRDRLAAEEMGGKGPLWVKTNRSYEATTSKILSIYEEILGHEIVASDGHEPPLGV